jgi:hypothetical protein
VMNCDLKIDKTYFLPSEYPALREFYTQVNKKTNEMAILKNNNSK